MHSHVGYHINYMRMIKKIDEGYLLSTRDLCSLQYIPDLIKAGVKCFKIEGRMKTPEYVAVCTRVYRKYIDLAMNDPENYKIDENDIKDLMQVFNRGGFSTGNLKSSANHDYVYNENQIIWIICWKCFKL